MRTQKEYRLECLRMAASLAASKNIKPGEVVQYAMEFLRWAEGDELAGTEKIKELAAHYRRYQPR